MKPNCTDVNFLGPWAWKRMGSECWSSSGRSALGRIDNNGNVLWACIYDNYEPGGSIQMHIAIDDPKNVSRQAITAVFEYPFYQLGVKKVLGFVNSENHTALSFDMRLGFQIEAVIKDVYDMGDLYILSMTREQCRWLKGVSNGQVQEAATAA